MDKQTSSIQVKNIKKSYGKVQVLKGVSFEVERGSIFALLGPNGAGKTTIVKILATLIELDSGSAKIEGIDVSTNADAVRRVIGLTGQYAAVDEYLSARENLMMMGRLYHLKKAVVTRRCRELLEEFDLVEAADRAAKTYSGGMRRRLDLAVSLIASPPILFLDEPTTGLDPRSRIAMWENIKKLAAGGSTVLLTTQYLEEADQLADKIVVIDGGKVIASGTADELKADVGNDRVEFSFGSDGELQKAANLLKTRKPIVDDQKRSLSIVNKNGVKSLQKILTELQEAHVKIDGVALHKPTLDDVFLQLTGHQATTTPTDTKAKEKK